MLKTLRNPKNIKMVMWAIIPPIIICFCLFYGWSSLTGTKDQNNNPTYAAKVNGVEISQQDYQDEYQRMIDQLKQMYGDSFNEQEAAQLGLAGQVLGELEDKALVLQEAPKMGISVSDVELSNVIENSKGFQDKTGRFSPNVYYSYLYEKRLTPAKFENQLRLDRMYTKAQNEVTDFVKVTEPEVREEFRKEFEKMSVDALRFSAVDFLQEVNVDDKEAETYYNAHKQNYTIPPQYSLAYLTISPKSFEKNIQITESEITEFYNDYPEQFTTPVRVHAEHILIDVPQNPTPQQKADIQRTYMTITTLIGKEPFEKVAKDFSQDEATKDKGGDLGWIKKGDALPEFEQAVFSTESGQIAVTQTKLGVHIIKVLGREEPRIQKLDEVKNAIIETLKTQDSDSAAEAQAELLLKGVTPQTKILDLAEKNGFSKGTTGWFTGDKIPGFEDNTDLASEILASSIPVGRVTGPVKTKAGYSIIQLVGKQESRIPAFNEIKTQVKTQLMFQKAQEDAQKKSQEADQMAKSGMPLEEIAAKEGRKIISLPPFSLADNIPGVGKLTSLATTAFNLPDGKTSGVISVNDPLQRGLVEYFIIKVKARLGASEANYVDEKAQIEQKVLQEKRRQVFQDWVQTLRKRAKIEVNKSLLAGNQANNS